ncbi:MAG: hypothetical protein PHX18_04680 [Candidatus Gastranaerophilales bacterium]|nr:hypothetical protein [Candidatus Gastranaerophilales bacterium]
MGIAALQASYLTLTAQKANYEFSLNVIDRRRQTLTLQGGKLMEEYMEKWALTSQETGAAEDNVDTFNWEVFQADYTAAQKKLEYQDKALELQRTNIQTQVTAITTQQESVQKQIEKNVQKDFQSSLG